MKLKKSNAVDLENRKHIYIIIGLILSLSFALNLLEWKSFKKKDVIIETSFVPQLNEEPILEIKPIQIPVPVKTVSNEKPSTVKVVKELPKINTIKVKTKTELFIPIESLMALENLEGDSLVIENVDPPIFVSTMPKFPGGNPELFDFLNSNIKYPEISVKNNSQGKVIIEFVVEENGEISNIKVLKGVDPFIDAESIRVVNQMPKWIPGKQLDKKVRVRQRLPIKFKLSY
jgi:protein TonB